jgi:endoglucanase
MSIADFSELHTPGTYVIVVPGLGYSYPFEIKSGVHGGLLRESIKAFYYQRMSTTLPEKYAGKWHRSFSHPDDRVLVHASAASARRPTGTVLSSRRGWYDAGDYNKYIVNSGITMGTLLSAYEDFPSYYDAVKLNIPESDNTVPDLLDEVLWNLRWMLTMQDPDDGGVYHKLTNAEFDKFVMPDKAVTPRYVVQKGTAATLDFAAVMAQAARVYKKIDQQFPGLSDSCLSAAKAAWLWAVKNPKVAYQQNALNKKFDPDIKTGDYGDGNFTDEFIWAAAELYVTTKSPSYYSAVDLFPDNAMPLPSWSQVRLLGYYSLIRFADSLPPGSHAAVSDLKKRLLQTADVIISDVDQRPFMTVIGSTARDFIWGSSSVAANQSIVLINAFRISGDSRYLKYALYNLDYLLGRNATGYSFVTGCGDKTPMHPHHRPSEADGIDEPVPGFLTGGPNPGMQDKCEYPSSIADEAYTDDVCSYASNEVAINWNAPLVYVAGAMEALHVDDPGSKSD